jgi:hypothetical protein
MLNTPFSEMLPLDICEDGKEAGRGISKGKTK